MTAFLILIASLIALAAVAVHYIDVAAKQAKRIEHISDCNERLHSMIQEVVSENDRLNDLLVGYKVQNYELRQLLSWLTGDGVGKAIRDRRN